MAYQNGVMVSEQPGFVFEPAIPLTHIVGGAAEGGVRARSFNGSFALIRVYDRALSAAEVLGNTSARAVEPDSKLTTTWGRIKEQYSFVYRLYLTLG